MGSSLSASTCSLDFASPQFLVQKQTVIPPVRKSVETPPNITTDIVSPRETGKALQNVLSDTIPSRETHSEIIPTVETIPAVETPSSLIPTLETPSDIAVLSATIEITSKDHDIPESKPLMSSPSELKPLMSSPSESKPLMSSPSQTLKDAHATKRIIYMDADIYWADPKVSIRNAIDAGYNVILFAFYLATGPWNMAFVWQTMSDSDKTELVEYANNRGAILGVTMGGPSEVLYLSNPVELATTVCNWVLVNKLQILDANFQNISPGFTCTGCDNLYEWMRLFFHKANQILGKERYLTASPQRIYLARKNVRDTWPGIRGGFSQVFQDSPFLDWLVIQQGRDMTYEDCFMESDSDTAPFSALAQLHDKGKGIPFGKMVVGTFLQHHSAPFHDPSDYSLPHQFRRDLERAAIEFNYHSGAAVWQYSTSGTPSPGQWNQIVFGSGKALFVLPDKNQIQPNSTLTVKERAKILELLFNREEDKKKMRIKARE